MYKKAIKVIDIVLAVYTVLVATHSGEFWPFSIYPMFQQAGNPWTRAVVRTVPDNPDARSWSTVPFENLHGESYPVVPRGISQNDVANYVSKTSTWIDQRLRGFRGLFESSYDFSKPLLIMKVRGALKGDSVSIMAMPIMRPEQYTTLLNPSMASAFPEEPTALSALAP